jgi:hypothetical protein
MRTIVLHYEDEVTMRVAAKGLSDGMVMETDVVPVPEMLLRDGVGGSALGHVGRVGSPNAMLIGVAVFIDKVELDEPVAMDVNIYACWRVCGG